MKDDGNFGHGKQFVRQRDGQRRTTDRQRRTGIPQNEKTTFLIGFDLNTDVRVASEKKKVACL